MIEPIQSAYRSSRFWHSPPCLQKFEFAHPEPTKEPGLIGFHYRRMDHSGTTRASCFPTRRKALKRIFDRVDGFLKDNLLRGMVELLTGEPTPLRQRPAPAAAVNPAMPEEERKKLLTLSAEDRPPRP